MPGFIERDEVRRLVDDEDAQVVEVLPRPEFDWAHLPGALHIPLKGWRPDDVRGRLDERRPVIAYCSDFL